MATTVDSLYASMKALVCIVGNNPVALREMERTGGFQVRYNEVKGQTDHLLVAIFSVCTLLPSSQ